MLAPLHLGPGRNPLHDGNVQEHLIPERAPTGQSIELTYQTLLQRGTPKHLHIVSLIGSAYGVAYLTEKLPHATLWLADIDNTLNEDGYIVPGLGDAGDLSYGEKR